MSGALKSLGGFAGLSDGPKAPDGTFANQGLDQLNNQNKLYFDPGAVQSLQDYASGKQTSAQALGKDYGTPQENLEMGNALATGATTGSKYATEQVQNNPILGGLYGQNGQLGQVEGKLSGLYNQGFELKPEDQTLYGQEAGNIARQFGQQGNQTANNLAARGLSSSGAAGAAFSGLAGNQNEMLSQAQQQIAQQRFQNTMSQIGQYQNFVNSMGSNANNAINQQFGRQLQGSQNQKNDSAQAANITQGSNANQNSYGLQKSAFDAANTPKNFMDFADAGAGQGLQAGISGAVAGQGWGGGGANNPTIASSKGQK